MFAGATRGAGRGTGVIDVSSLAVALNTPAGPFDAGDFALQLVVTPESQPFQPVT